ncbi:MAG: TIGR03621 family F420-dependent LLM class oxidoreductase [Ilumatobacteraceae bacterium]
MNEFRFGYQVSRGDGDDLRRQAREAEAAGFDVISTWDHVADGLTPLLPLLAMADVTDRIRVCPMVINNDFHHPVNLAMEFADLDHLTGGRAELAIGAGHAFTEYTAMGLAFDPPAVRKRRLAESIEILRRLLDGETVTHRGEHYRITEARIKRSLQDHLPIMAAVNGQAGLAHAAQHADIIGLMMLGKTLDDGNSHEVRWEADRLDATVAHIHEHAAGRPIELNALVQMIIVSDDRRAAAENLCAAMPTLQVDDALDTPFLAIGTHDEIAEHFFRCRERWGISYLTVRSIPDFAPLIERLRTTPADSVSVTSAP